MQTMCVSSSCDVENSQYESQVGPPDIWPRKLWASREPLVCVSLGVGKATSQYFRRYQHGPNKRKITAV
jgi:hypothetical protein